VTRRSPFFAVLTARGVIRSRKNQARALNKVRPPDRFDGGCLDRGQERSLRSGVQFPRPALEELCADRRFLSIEELIPVDPDFTRRDSESAASGESPIRTVQSFGPRLPSCGHDAKTTGEGSLRSQAENLTRMTCTVRHPSCRRPSIPTGIPREPKFVIESKRRCGRRRSRPEVSRRSQHSQLCTATPECSSVAPEACQPPQTPAPIIQSARSHPGCDRGRRFLPGASARRPNSVATREQARSLSIPRSLRPGGAGRPAEAGRRRRQRRPQSVRSVR
jgi:hypothetical protein